MKSFLAAQLTVLSSAFVGGKASPWMAHVDVDWEGTPLVEETRTVATVEV